MQAQRPALPSAIQKLYPFATRQVNLDGEQMSFAENGNADAPPLLFVHGSLTWSFLFRRTMEACTEKFHVIAPDQVGFGLSSKPAQPDYHTLERHIENLAALVESLGVERVTLVLHEWGGPVGLGYATRFPQKVERIVLLNTWALPIGTDPRVPWQLHLLRGFAGSIAPRTLLTSALRRLSARTLRDDEIAGYQFPLTQPNGLVGPLAFAHMLPLQQSGENARTYGEITANLKSSVTARVEIVWGKRDPILGSPLRAYMLRDSFSNAAEPRCLDDAGHFVPEDAPEALTDVLLAPFRPKLQTPKSLFNILK